MKNTDWTSLSIGALIISGLLIMFSFIAPLLFTMPSSNWNFTETGPIGDTIGGTMGPFIALGGVIMTFLAFYMQVRANKLQRNQFLKTLNKEYIDEKIYCFYLLKLLSLDLEEIIKDFDKRKVQFDKFTSSLKADPYQFFPLKRSLMNVYTRAKVADRLTLFKSFQFFLSDYDDWVKDFNNLYRIQDFLPEALKQLYKIVDNHNLDIFKDKKSIRNLLIDFEKKAVSLINNNYRNNQYLDSNFFIVSAIQKYRVEIEKSSIENKETDFCSIEIILNDLKKLSYPYIRMNPDYIDLNELLSIISEIFIKLSFIKQKTNQILPEIQNNIDNIVNEDQNSHINKLKSIKEIIDQYLEKVSIDKLRKEYNDLPNYNK